MGKFTVMRRRRTNRGLIRVAIYLRVSTPQQVKLFGLKAQKDANYAWLDYKLGKGDYVVHKIYSDAGVSGKLASRPDFDQMNADIEAGLIDLVIFGKLDRVGRTMKDIHRWVYDTTEREIRIATADGRIDSYEEMFEIQLALLAYMAELEHTLIVERTMGGREQKLAAGGWPLGQPPYGVALAGRGGDAKPVLSEYECRVIDWAATFMVDEGLSRDEAAAKINLLGFTTRTGRTWDGANLAARVDSTALDGYAEFNISVRGADEDDADAESTTGYRIPVPRPIEDENRVAALRRALKRNTFVKKNRYDYLLSRRFFSLCGSHYTGAKANNEQAYYRCMGKRDGLDCNCRELPLLEVEMKVCGEVEELLADASKFKDLVDKWLGATPERVASYKKRLTRVESELNGLYSNKTDRILAMLAQLSDGDDDDLDLEAIAQVKADLKEKNRDKSKQLREERDRLMEWIKDAEGQQEQAKKMLDAVGGMKDHVHSFSFERKADLIELLDVEVTVTGEMPYAPHKGKPDPLTEWHRATDTPVPAGPLTDEQWAVVEPLLPKSRQQKNMAPTRELFEAIANKIRTEGRWTNALVSAGAWNTVYRRASAWHDGGHWKAAMEALKGVCAVVDLPPRYVLPPMRVTGAIDPKCSAQATRTGRKR